MKKNWKKLYEETAGLLKLARDAAKLHDHSALTCETCRSIDDYVKSQYKGYEELLKAKPFEKIVEKEVLPLWVFVIVVSLGIFWTFSLCVGVDIVKQLQQPILSPYPVYIAKYVPPDPYALDVCKDAWRADERELRKLRKELK